MSSNDQETKHELSIEERRSRLERKAEVIRSRLFRHVDALDARRHQVTEVGRRAKETIPAAIGVVLASGALLGVGIGLITWAVRSRKKHLLSYRISKAIEPFRVEKRPSMFAEVGRKLLVTAVTIVASELTKRAAKNAFDGRVLDGALAVPQYPVTYSNGTHEGSMLHRLSARLGFGV